MMLLALCLTFPCLAQETPFELRHAKDQVHWLYWSQDAVAQAKDGGRPIILSLGFEGCPGCETMSAESFSNAAIATLMNEQYTPLLVDADAWPEVAQQYAALAVELGIKPEYPLNLFLTPEMEPFAATGYLPPTAAPGDPPGWLDTLELVSEAWQADPEEAVRTAKSLTAELATRLDTASPPAKLSDDVRDAALTALKDSYDAEFGGFGMQWKTIPCLELSFLLRESVARKDTVLRRMVTQTIDRIAASPTYDPIAGGVFSGCVDRAWQVPNFEKRLSDNALFAALLVDVNLVTGDAKYRDLAEQTLTYIVNRLRRDDGALVDGQRGNLSLWGWSAAQARAVLGDDLGLPAEPVAPGPLKLTEEQRQKLLDSRAEAQQSAWLVDTRLASNGLTITAFAKAAQAWGEPSDAENAVKVGLSSRWIWPTDGTPADLDDYALLASSYVDLWEMAFVPEWLNEAQELVAQVEQKLGGDAAQAFYLRPVNAVGPPVRERRAVDGALPAGNAVMAKLLLRLSRLQEDHDQRARAEAVLQSFGQAAEADSVHHLTLLGAQRWLNPQLPGIAILGPAEDAGPLLAAARSIYLPERVIAWLDPAGEDADAIKQAASLFENRSAGETARAYVCSLTSCKRPVNTPEQLIGQLQ